MLRGVVVDTGDQRAVWELAGVHPDDIDWVIGHGLRPELVEDWLRHCGADYDPQSWVRWHRAGVKGSSNRLFGLAAYRRRGIEDPETVAVLTENDIPASVAWGFCRRGVTDPQAIVVYADAAIPPFDAARYQHCGFTADEGVELFDAGVSGVAALVAARLGYCTVDDVILFNDAITHQAM